MTEEVVGQMVFRERGHSHLHSIGRGLTSPGVAVVLVRDDRLYRVLALAATPNA
jgi:hypothetical protein